MSNQQAKDEYKKYLEKCSELGIKPKSFSLWVEMKGAKLL